MEVEIAKAVLSLAVLSVPLVTGYVFYKLRRYGKYLKRLEAMIHTVAEAGKVDISREAYLEKKRQRKAA